LCDAESASAIKDARNAQCSLFKRRTNLEKLSATFTVSARAKWGQWRHF
jgi:hypothetical protein